MVLSLDDKIIIIVVVVSISLLLLAGFFYIFFVYYLQHYKKQSVVYVDLKEARGIVKSTKGTAINDEEITLRSGSVEKFSSEVMHANKTDSVRYVFSNPAGRDAFVKFLRTEYCEENFLFFQEIENLKKLEDKSKISATAKRVSNKFIKEGAEYQVNISCTMKSNVEKMMEDPGHDDELLQSLLEAQNEIVAILGMGAFPRFLKSTEYAEYLKLIRRDARLLSTATDVEEIFHEPEISSPLGRAIQFVDHNEVDKILGMNTWFKSLIASVENLPMSVCISSARKERWGFPLIYVNAQFEKMTGYSRTEVVGINCKFLQCEDTDLAVVKEFTDALRQAQPFSGKFINQRKNKTRFMNVVSSKPVFDEATREYAYVITLQYAISAIYDEEVSELKRQFFEQLLKILPDTTSLAGHDCRQVDDSVETFPLWQRSQIVERPIPATQESKSSGTAWSISEISSLPTTPSLENC